MSAPVVKWADNIGEQLIQSMKCYKSVTVFENPKYTNNQAQQNIWIHLSNILDLSDSNKNNWAKFINNSILTNSTADCIWLHSVNDIFNDSKFFSYDIDGYYSYEFNIGYKRDNIAVIATYEELNSFVEEFYQSDKSNIDWNAVSAKYNGIAFLNYNQIKKDICKKQSTSNDTNIITNSIDPKFEWYYRIGYTSVCIFNAEVLELVKIREHTEIY